MAISNLAISVLAETDNYINSMNRTLANSGIDNFHYRNSARRNFASPSYQGDADLVLFHDFLKFSDPEDLVFDFKREERLDQVMMLAGSTVSDGVYGISDNQILLPGDRDLTVVRVTHNNRLTAAHEMGHNHGCKHDDDNSVDISAGLDFESRGYLREPGPGQSFRATLMVKGGSINTTSRRRTEVTSTPTLHPTFGVIGSADHDNRDQMIETGCAMSKIRQSTPTDNDLTIYALSSQFPGGAFVEFSTFAICNDGEYGSRVWKLALGNGGYNQVEVTGGDYVTFKLPNLAKYPQLAYLRQESKCADNPTLEVDTYAFYITAPYEEAPVEPGPENRSPSNVNYAFQLKPDNSIALTISPAPDAEIPDDFQIIKITYTDLLGRSLALPAPTSTGSLERDGQRYEISAAQLDRGIGYLTIYSTDGVESTLIDVRQR